MLSGRSVRGWRERIGSAGARSGARLVALVLLGVALLVAGASPRTAAAEGATARNGEAADMIVLLQVRLPRGRMDCTGFMVGPHTVATAAHCLFHPEMGGLATHAVVTPGLDGVHAPFAAVEATSFAVNSTWVHPQDITADYAAVTLPTDAVGRATGWFNLRAPSDFDLSIGRYETAGYSVSRFGSLWRMPEPGVLLSHTDDFLHYQWGTSPGESGAPIFERTEGGYDAVGVLKGAYSAEEGRIEVATRLDAGIVDFYRRQAAEPLPEIPDDEPVVPTMFSAAEGTPVDVSSPVTLPDVDSVLQASNDQVRWTTVARARTSAEGVATYRITPSRTTFYRVVVAGVGTGRVSRGYVTAAGAGSGASGNFATPPTFDGASVTVAVFQGGTVDQLSAALIQAGASVALVPDADGVPRLYLLGGGSLNDAFVEAFRDGIPPATSVTLYGS
ncbi:MAG: serine protease [Dehalococcoidia bacterium]